MRRKTSIEITSGTTVAVGDNSGNGDCQYDACVTAPDPGQNPCVMVVGGVDDSTGDLAAANTMGGVASYPLGQDVVGGSNALGTGALGVGSVASQGFLGFGETGDRRDVPQFPETGGGDTPFRGPDFADIHQTGGENGDIRSGSPAGPSASSFSTAFHRQFL